MNDLAILPGDLVDLDAVMAVMDDSFEPAFGEAWTAPQCAGLMPMTGVWLTLAKRGETVVGFSLARIIAGEAELLLLAVLRQEQRRGAGRMLIEAFTNKALTMGADRLHLEVREGNPAVGLYARNGFREVGRRRGYYTGCDGQMYDALTLSRSLSAQPEFRAAGQSGL